MPDNLDREVRLHDEDRWLASRFAPAGVRARLIALYAVNYEIARTAEVVTQAAVGDIRLAWWREALAEIAEGKAARAHPAVAAYAEAWRQTPAPAGAAERLIEARAKDLEATPFASWAELTDYLDATAGGVMRLAAAASGGAAQEHEHLIAAAAQAWGGVGLLRAEAHWRARGRSWVPRDGGGGAGLKAHAKTALDEARELAGVLPAQLFPALGYVALAGGYLRALERGRADTPLLQRQLRLIAASATGRL
jgi:15-cis-phytoene synthase